MIYSSVLVKICSKSVESSSYRHDLSGRLETQLAASPFLSSCSSNHLIFMICFCTKMKRAWKKYHDYRSSVLQMQYIMIKNIMMSTLSQYYHCQLWQQWCHIRWYPKPDERFLRKVRVHYTIHILIDSNNDPPSDPETHGLSSSKTT